MKFKGKNVLSHQELLEALVGATLLTQDMRDSLHFAAQKLGNKGRGLFKGFANIRIREPGTDDTAVELTVQPGGNTSRRLFRVNAPQGMSALGLYQELKMAKAVRVAVMKLGRQFFSNSDFRVALLIIKDYMSELKVENGRSGEYQLPDLGLEASLWQAFERGLSRARVVEFVEARSRDPKNPRISARIDQELFKRFVDYGCKIYPEVATAPVSPSVPVPTPAVPEQEVQDVKGGDVDIEEDVAEDPRQKNNKVKDWMREDMEVRLPLVLSAIQSALTNPSNRRLVRSGTMDVSGLKKIVARELNIEHLVLAMGSSFCYALLYLAECRYLIAQKPGSTWRFGITAQGVKKAGKFTADVEVNPKESATGAEDVLIPTVPMSEEERAATIVKFVGFARWFNRPDLKHLQDELGFGTYGGLRSWLNNVLFKTDWTIDNGANGPKKRRQFVRDRIPAEILRLVGFGPDQAPVKTNGQLPVVGTAEWYDWATGRSAVLPEQLETCDRLIRDAEQKLAEARAYRERVVREQEHLTRELAEYEERQEEERKRQVDDEAARLIATLSTDVLAAIVRKAQTSAE